MRCREDTDRRAFGQKTKSARPSRVARLTIHSMKKNTCILQNVIHSMRGKLFNPKLLAMGIQRREDTDRPPLHQKTDRQTARSRPRQKSLVKA